MRRTARRDVAVVLLSAPALRQPAESKKIGELLDALAALGQARRAGEGRFVA